MIADDPGCGNSRGPNKNVSKGLRVGINQMLDRCQLKTKGFDSECRCMNFCKAHALRLSRGEERKREC